MPHACIPSFPPTKTLQEGSGCVSCEGCCSLHLPLTSGSPWPCWGKIINDQKRFHSARKKQNSIHMATHMFTSTRVDGAGPTFRPHGSLEDQSKSHHTPNCLKTRTNRKDKGSCEISRKSAKSLVHCHNVTKMGPVCPFLWLRLLKIHRLNAVLPQWFSDVSSDTSCPSVVRLLLPFDLLL